MECAAHKDTSFLPFLVSELQIKLKKNRQELVTKLETTMKVIDVVVEMFLIPPIRFKSSK